LQNAIGIGGVHLAAGTETAAALGVFGLEQVPFAGVGPHDFATGGDLKAFSHRFLRFDAFGTSHIVYNPFISKGREL
jgi:hypothetical protein